ncbi:hybrid sensor histidine kinase/response regulator [Spirosoma endophyticum]|uniref:histidine kinase n=1 Tax=Spirosoma endophyticum TaxID=662367 RepID=A0A1I2HYG0_9BACT|nr:ATP-binding protein [Spirosoma endophyticum]SFF33391.1 Signal transduction histidine kinase [Spirosoma endophyticum]
MIFSHYVPPADITDEDQKIRFRHFNTCSQLTIITMVVIVVGNILFDFHQVLIISIIFLFIFSAIFYGFYKCIISLNLSVNFFIGAGAAFVGLGAFVSGGFSSPVLFWSLLIPLHAFWLLNKKSALGWFIVASILPILFIIFDFAGFRYEEPYNYFEGNNRYYALVTILFLILYTFTIGNTFENNKIRSLKEVNEANEELRVTLSQLEITKNKLETAEKHKDLFIAQMSHEMRTPMNAIVGVSELLKSNINDDKDELVEILDRSSKHLLYIIEDILDITKIQTGKFHYHAIIFDLKPVLKTVYDSNKRMAESKKISFYLQIMNELPEKLVGDPYRLSQILNNLIGNAIKFTEKGEVRFTIAYEEESKTIIYTINDTGIGMSDEEVSKVFDIFSQANSEIHLKFGGTGMGLSITRQLVELFKGRIHVKSKIGKGTMVTVALPAKIQEQYTFEEVIDEVILVKIKDKLSGLKILIAEDNETNKLIVKKLLHSEVPLLKIDFASNGDEVLSMVLESNYDIILMDIQMPNKSGLETTKIIRAHTDKKISSLKIIALTAFARKSEAANFLAIGMNDYASKPIIKLELIQKIYNLVSND